VNRPCIAVVAWLASFCAAGQTEAAQMTVIGAYEAHYSVVPTLFLKPDVAASYGITRGRDRALLNVSIIETGRGPVVAGVTGTVRDLLGQRHALEFSESVEGDAVYYLATLRFTDGEHLAFAIEVETPDGNRHTVEFQQPVYEAAP
jgi:Domain of unknown function (DUF4426)